jgi:lipoate-protein ligase A
METWRLVMDGPGDGAWNMAVDEALLHLAERGNRPPVLRFYSWARPTLTIGRLQKTGGSLNLDYLAARGIPIVRRPTGGRALLHCREVTYSAIIPSASPAFGPMRHVYSIMAGAIGQALTDIGVAPDPLGEGAGQDYAASSFCLATRTGFEISAGGRKVAACAQRRLKNSILQHGSIILAADAGAHLGCFVWKDAKRRDEAARALAGLEEMAPGVTSAKVIDSMIAALGGISSIRFEASPLDAGERASAREIVERMRGEARVGVES